MPEKITQTPAEKLAAVQTAEAELEAQAAALQAQVATDAAAAASAAAATPTPASSAPASSPPAADASAKQPYIAWATALKTPTHILAGAVRFAQWPVGLEVTQDQFTSAVADFTGQSFGHKPKRASASSITPAKPTAALDIFANRVVGAAPVQRSTAVRQSAEVKAATAAAAEARTKLGRLQKKAKAATPATPPAASSK